MTDEYERWQNQMDEVSLNEIQIISNLAWEQTMNKTDVCDCGADERRECRCRRTGEFSRRSKALKEILLPDAWQKDPLKMEMGRIVDKNEAGTE